MAKPKPKPMKNPNEGIKSTDEETNTKSEESLATVPPSEPQEAPSEPQKAPSEPQKAPSQVLRPTLRRDGTSEPDQHLAMLTIKREVLFLEMCSWITASLCAMTKIALTIAIVFFLSLCFNWKHGREFMKVVGGFWEYPDQASYSQLTDSMFPSSEIDKSYHVTFKVTDSSFVNAAVLFEVTYPLLLRNPAILSLVLFSTLATYRFLSFAHGFLLNVINVMNAQLRCRDLPLEPAHQPESS